MPSNWLYIDTNFPSFTQKESANDKIETMQDYLFMLVEQLRYTLHNLDLSNMNKAAADGFVKTITDPIYGEIADAEGNITQIALAAEGLAGRISDAEGNITQLQATATGLRLHRKRQRENNIRLRSGRGHFHVERLPVQFARGIRGGAGPRGADGRGEDRNLPKAESQRLQHHVLMR